MPKLTFQQFWYEGHAINYSNRSKGLVGTAHSLLWQQLMIGKIAPNSCHTCWVGKSHQCTAGVCDARVWCDIPATCLQCSSMDGGDLNAWPIQEQTPRKHLLILKEKKLDGNATRPWWKNAVAPIFQQGVRQARRFRQAAAVGFWGQASNGREYKRSKGRVFNFPHPLFMCRLLYSFLFSLAGD